MADAIDDLFRRFGKAFNKADVEEIAACVTDDFEWRLNAGGSPGGRVLKGKDDLRAHFADKSLPIARRASRRRASIARVTNCSAPSASPASTMPASRSTATASISTS
jgi:ketosteroid isomerase-like protein